MNPLLGAPESNSFEASANGVAKENGDVKENGGSIQTLKPSEATTQVEAEEAGEEWQEKEKKEEEKEKEQEEEEKEEQEEQDLLFEPSLFLNTEYILRSFRVESGFELQLYTLPSASTDFDLTGQIPWPAAQHLAEFIHRHPETVSDRNVLELGSGLGLAGLSAARYCRHVTLTDGNNVVMEVLERNVQRNLPDLQLLNDKLTMGFKKLQWGKEEPAHAVLASLPAVPDIIIGADICYQEKFLEPLFSTLDLFFGAHKKHGQGETCLEHWRGPRFYLAYCERNRRTTSRLHEVAELHNFSIQKVPGSSAFVDGGHLEAHVFLLEKK